MLKSAFISIYLDGITYSEIEVIEDAIQKIIEDVERKRVTVSIQDETLLPEIR